MIETFLDIWDYTRKPNVVILVTTNGGLRKDGTAIMGRGCALQAAQRYPELPHALGIKLAVFGNVVHDIGPNIMSFPVKHNWREPADPVLIAASSAQLKYVAEHEPKKTFILPRPGCGSGRLKWSQVKPLLQDLPDNVWVCTNR